MPSVFRPRSQKTTHALSRSVILVLLSLPFYLLCTVVAQTPKSPPPIANFTDEAEKAGLTAKNTFGGKDTKKYIIETTGTGIAIFDYDNDGWPDIFLVNGTTLEGAGGTSSTNHLYHNNHDGTFTDVTREAGLAVEMYGMGCAVGDYDNDGKIDIYITTLGSNHLFHNLGNGKFADVTAKAGVDDPGFSVSAVWFD